jgi:hypothetical protein
MIINPLNEKIVPILAEAGVKTVTTSVGSLKRYTRSSTTSA